MKRYEYVRVKIPGFFTFRSEEHRAIIDDYAKRGFRYVGFIPAVQSEYGIVREMDLVFEKDTEDAE